MRLSKYLLNGIASAGAYVPRYILNCAAVGTLLQCTSMSTLLKYFMYFSMYVATNAHGQNLQAICRYSAVAHWRIDEGNLLGYYAHR